MKMLIVLSLRMLLCIYAIALLFTNASSATVFDWQSFGGSPSGSFTDEDHWSGVGTPGVGDTANISLVSGSPYQVTLSNTFFSIEELNITQANATLAINSGISNSALTVANGFSNAGTIVLDGNNEAGETASLILTTGSLTNNGTLSFNSSADSKTFTGGLINNGTVTLSDNTVNLNGGAANQFTNHANFTVHNTSTLFINGGSEIFTQSGGTLANNGTFNMTSATFVMNGGNVTGNSLALGTNANLEITPTGTGSLDVTFTNSGHTFTGNLYSGQEIKILAGISSNTVTSANSFTNEGTIILDGNGDSGETATLSLTNGSLTNEGTLTFASSQDSVSLNGGLINNGTVTVSDDNTHFNGGAANQFTNNASFTINSGSTLTIDGGNETFTQSGGTLVNNGTFNMTSATFVMNGGNVTGNSLALGTNADLEITPTGTGSLDATFTNSGHTFTGNLYSGQKLTIESGVSHAVVTSANAFSNAGTITFAGNGDSGEVARLTITSGNLTNEGTLDFASSFDSHILDAPLLNNGEVIINDADVVFAQTVTNQDGGTFSGTGSLSVTGGDFVNEGILSPGNSIGSLTINDNVTNSATSELFIEIGGVSTFDILFVSGTYFIDGSISLDFLNDFVPGSSDVFSVVRTGGVTGSISDFNNVAGDGSFSYGSINGFARISGDNIELYDLSIVPEPSTYAALAGLGVLSMAIALRRKARA